MLVTYSIWLSKTGHTNRLLTYRQIKLAKIVFQNIRDQLQLILCETQFFYLNVSLISLIGHSFFAFEWKKIHR